MTLPKIVTCLTECYDKEVNSLLNCRFDLLLLAIRTWIGWVFLKSGLTKIDNFAALFTRSSCLPFIAMSIIIQLLFFSYDDHFYWIFLITTLLIYGAGRISADFL